MTTFILAAMLANGSLVTPDPKPIAMMDPAAYQIGVQRITVCENGVCRIVEVEVPDAAPLNNAPSAHAADCGCGASCACGAPAAAASNRSRPLLFDRVRSWYPGKLFQSFRVGRSAARGFCN